jgi:hypothetical protein
MVAKTIRGDNTGATDEVFQYEERVGGVFFLGQGGALAEPSTPSTFPQQWHRGRRRKRYCTLRRGS